jgi:SAM-dependent methyltransferase
VCLIVASQSSHAYDCPTCLASAGRLFASVGQRDYLRCEACHATFLRPDQLPSLEREREEYRLHRNRADDPAYRAFARPLAELLLARLESGCDGLDYGCGPDPALAASLRQAGHRVTLYDPLFHPDPEALRRQYDFIACSEVVEHFHRPAREFARLDALLKPGGWLAIQTTFQTRDAAFARWNYRRDPTHVVFYRQRTFERIALRHDWEPSFPSKKAALMKKRA